jgi:hypothetical protein
MERYSSIGTFTEILWDFLRVLFIKPQREYTGTQIVSISSYIFKFIWRIKYVYNVKYSWNR